MIGSMQASEIDVEQVREKPKMLRKAVSFHRTENIEKAEKKTARMGPGQ
jgi:hypothetical protein